MANNVTQAGRILQIEFESHITPVVKKKTGKPWLYWGTCNDYPNYLLELYKRDAAHGGLIKSKADHVYGKGLCYDSENLTVGEQATYELFLSKANRYEDWNSIFKKTTEPFEIFNGFAWQIIYGYNGKISEVYVQEFAKFRCSPCGKKIFYCEKWINEDGKPNSNPESHESFKEYLAFNPSIRTGTQILYFKTEVQTAQEYGNIYPEPGYIQGCQDIETNIEITNFHYSNLKNGMFAAAMLSLFNGEPTEDEKKKYEKLFQRKFSGTSNTGRILFNFVDKGGEEAKLTTLTQADLDKMFEAAGTRSKENIFTAHRTDPVLANIFLNGTSIGENTIYLQKFDRWVKSYVEHQQEIILSVVKDVAYVNGVDLSYLEVKQKAPASNMLPVDANTLFQLFDKATLQKHYAKQLGIEIETEVVEGSQPVAEAQVNEHIKRLSGRDWQHIKRVVREVTNGKLSREAGAMMLKNAYALTDADIQVLFNTPQAQFSKFDKLVDGTSFALELFEKFSIDDNDDEVISEEFVTPEYFKRKFDDDLVNKQPNKTIRDYILDILKGAPQTPASQIAKQLGIDVLQVETTLKELNTGGLIEIIKDKINITDKGNNTNTPNAEYETYTVYKYVTRDGVPSAETSRPFCKRLLALSNSGKRWTRDALDEITNQFGEDAWTYRGGFYTNPDTGETTPYCRHIWKSVTKVRKKGPSK